MKQMGFVGGNDGHALGCKPETDAATVAVDNRKSMVQVEHSSPRKRG